MPKVIQPKRLNKNITVESYWEIRNKQKKTKKQTPLQAYRQEEVANRYRYLKPTQQAKLFNPLNYFFRRESNKANIDEQYAKNFRNQESTNVSQFLSSVRFRVSPPLIRIKKLSFGLKSIIYNHKTILNIILQNLHCEDSWPLLQAVIKDTKSQSYDYFIAEGLQKLAYQGKNQQGKRVSIYKNFFKQTLFQNLFDTLAMIMQNNYSKIMENINQFFNVLNVHYFTHPNKYIRRFSMKSVSYILNNFTLQQNLSLIFHILLSNKSLQEINEIPIGQLLLNRHKAVKGCLSSVQINKVIETLKEIPLFLSKSFESTQNQMNTMQKDFKIQLQGKIQNILIDYIAGILDLLDTKFGRAEQNENSSQILFDINYCIKAFVSLQEKQQCNMKQIALIKAFGNYLEICDEKRFLTHNQKHQAYINQTFKLILVFIQNATLRLLEKQPQSTKDQNNCVEVSKILSLIFVQSPKQSAKMILSKGIIQFCKQLSIQNAYNLLQKIYASQLSELEHSQEKSLGQFLLMSFSKFLKQFYQVQKIQEQSNGNRPQLLYIIYRILKRIGFNNTLNLEYLNLTKTQITKKLQSIQNIHQFILFCRLLSLINIEAQSDKKFAQELKSSIKKVYEKLTKPFSQSLVNIFKENKDSNNQKIFMYQNHIKNLLRYSHHEVQWVNLSYNLQQCYKQCINNINKSSKQEQSKQKWFWSELSLNRTLKIDQSLSLQSIFSQSLNLLQSRNRLARKSILQRISQLWEQKNPKLQNLHSIIRRLLFIDSDDIDLDNQRDIKKEFVLLHQQVSQIKNNTSLQKDIIHLLSHWIIGFTFTGFKLINQSIVSFITLILENFSLDVKGIILPFVEYYIYRHSRQFQFDISENQNFVLRTPKKVQNQFNNLKERTIFYSLMKEDFNIQDQNTIEWIGLQRIGQSLLHARKFKNNQSIKPLLQNFLNQYFDQEFFRKSRTLSSLKVGQDEPNKHLILQPKTRFLLIMLKICPDTYLPPFQCLHYVSAEYFSLTSVHNIKQNRWQAIWMKKLKGSKTRQQITDTVNTTIQLQKMSIKQQQLYAHFLWKQIIQANQQKRRNLFEHIRDRVPNIINYMFQKLLYSQMIYVENPSTYFASLTQVRQRQIIAQIKQRLRLQNKRSLLNIMYVIKAMIVIFKNFLRDSSHIQNIVLILRAIIQLVYDNKTVKKQKEEEHDSENQQDDQLQENDDNQQLDVQEEEQQEKKQEKDQFTLYKPHRKQIYKVLTQLFTHHGLQYKTAESILAQVSLSYLPNQQLNQVSSFNKAFSKIAYASINSVPGILILLKIISDDHFYHHLLLNFGIFDLMASIIDITELSIDQNKDNKKSSDMNKMEQQNQVVHKKKQSNPHAVKQCLNILTNIFQLNQQNLDKNSKMVEQSTLSLHTKQSINYHKWNQSLKRLLRSINHYFIYSRNLQQISSNGNSNIQLDYYSNQNKQNMKSIQNNKNRNKNENQRHQIQNRILDVLWDVVAKIVSNKEHHHDQKAQQTQVQPVRYSIILDSQWQLIFWSEINKILKSKQLKQKQYHKLFKIVQIALIYFDQRNHQNSFETQLNTQTFLCKIISVLPYISQLSQRVKLTQLIHRSISTPGYKNSKLINQSAVTTIKQINAVKRTGLNIEIDYDSFFSAINKYAQQNINFRKGEQMIDQNSKQLNLLSHQFVIYNILPYLTSQELSVRKAVRQALNSFLIRMSVHLRQFQKQTLNVFNSIFRILTQQLKKNQIDNVYWSILSCIGLFIRFQVKFTQKLSKIFQNQTICNKIFSGLVKLSTQYDQSPTFQSQSEEDFFHMISSISQGNKMKALRLLKQHCIKLRQSCDVKIFKQQQKGSCLPHPMTWMLSILQHLVLPVKHFVNQHQYNVQGNLTSTLTHISLQIYEQIIPFARQSLVKKQLKRLSTKIKFNQSQRTNQDSIKKNILVIKIISSIVEGIDSLQKCTGNIKKHIQKHGFDDFHSKLIQNARKTYKDAEESDQQSNEEQQKKKIQFGANLQQLESQEAINRNFMMFDRKLMQMQQKQNQTTTQHQNQLIKFLKLHILIPLKLMLFYENKSSKQNKEQQDKSRMLVSVAITKLLIKFPMEMFLFEFQKILSKICKLMKKRKLQIRQNGRKSLIQIAKIVGPQMLYAIVLQLKFHLRDNFQKHIFNFTVYDIIQNLSPLKQGQLDYCLPLILPMVVDEMFGQASEQKKMVDANQVPVLNMQTKKKKGHQLLILLSKQISVQRIRYMIDYLQKFLKEYLNSQANVSKYQMMIGYLTNGLGNNDQFTAPQNAGIFGQILCDSMYELRKQIKIYNFQQQKNKIVHESTIKVNTQKSKKVGKQALLLQQQAGRNGSIFKKMSKQVYEKRNKQILINCLVQFYLALGSLLIKKQVLSLKTLQGCKQLTANFIKIMQFVFECMDHRDNRIVSKCMRLLHQALIWNYEKSTSQQLKQSIKSLRKKVSRKILLFMQKLTSSDEQLLKQSFVILIDLFSQVTITKQFLPSIIAIIKLHTNNQNDSGNISQPYRLLKLIIYKVPQSIYDPLIYEMYELARINIVNSSIRQIRDVCKMIASTYVKNKEYLMTGIQLTANANKDKHDNKNTKNIKQNQQPLMKKSTQQEYLKRIKNQLNFYISNLDCRSQQNQLLVLEIIQEWVNNRTKSEIEEVSELVLLSLATSVVNGNQHTQKISSIIANILKTIDKTKVYQFIEKTLVWVAQPKEKAMIIQCGFFLLHSILSNKIISIQNQNVKSQYLLKNTPSSFLDTVQNILTQQVAILQDYMISQKSNNKKNKVQDKDWNSILDAIEIQDPNPYINENKILLFCLKIIEILIQNPEYQEKIKRKHIIKKVWILLKIPQDKICQTSIRLLIKVNNLGIHLQSEYQTQIQSQQEQQNEQQNARQQQFSPNKQFKLKFNYRSTILAFVNNNIDQDSVLSLMKKLHGQISIGQHVYTSTFNLVIGLLGKVVMKFKMMQPKVQAIYSIFNFLINSQDKRQLIFKNEERAHRIIDTVGKVSRSQFVSIECKTLNQQSMNMIKELFGVSQFYKALTKIQSERREKKFEQKANLAKLAVTDQKAYQDAKKKKVKRQNF